MNAIKIAYVSLFLKETLYCRFISISIANDLVFYLCLLQVTLLFFIRYDSLQRDVNFMVPIGTFILASPEMKLVN